MRSSPPGALRLRRARPPFRALAACGLALTLAAPADSAEDERRDETQRWVPAIGVSFDLFGQRGSGSAIPGRIQGPPLTDGPDLNGNLGCLRSGSPDRYGDQLNEDVDGSGPDGLTDLCPVVRPSSFSPNPGNPPPPGTDLVPYQLQPDNRDEDDNVLPMVGGSFELMTPRLVEGLAQPRLFAHVDLAWAFGFERRLAGVGAPEAFAPPTPIPSVNDIQEDTVRGQGTRSNLKTGDLVVSAGAGVAFAARLLGRSLRVKPSFEYIRQEVEISGTVNRAVKLEDMAQPGTLDQFRLVSLRSEDTRILHGIGGGIELEADTSRLGPLMLSVFLQGRAYYFPSTLDETLSATNAFGETATWTFRLDPWAWRSGVGLRFRWLPER